MLTKILLISSVLVWISGCASRAQPFQAPEGALTSQQIYEQVTQAKKSRTFRLQPPPAQAPVIARRVAVADPLYRQPPTVTRTAQPLREEPMIQSWRPGHYATDAYIWVEGYAVQYPLFDRYIEPHY